MAGRNAAPKPAEPKLANRHPHQRKPEYESVTTVNYRKTEKDVVKLIHCLAEWTQDLQAARSGAPEVTVRRRRSRSDAPKVIATMPLTRFYPRGNPLTDWMEFTDRDGAVWLAYVEGAREAPKQRRWRATILPDRHLRFDSATQSLFTSLLPAGAPFLAEARLQSLLDQAKPDLLPMASTTRSPARVLFSPGSWAIGWSSRAVGSARDAIASWSRQWQQTASQREATRRQILALLSKAANTVHGMVEVLLGQRPARQ
jgi:hypothetical protein